MATGHNTWILDGRIAFEPELRTTANGIPICTLRLGWSNNSGGREASVWVNAVCWRNLAQVASRYLTKGALVGVEGEVHGRERSHPDGRRAYELEINVEKLVFFPRSEQREEIRDEGIGDYPSGEIMDEV